MKRFYYKFFLLYAIFLNIFNCMTAQNISDEYRYKRNSIYTMLVEHPGYKFGDDIKNEFLKIPLPNKFNNHNLSVRSFLEVKSKDQRNSIDNFLMHNDVAKRMVSKWFDRDYNNGFFDMQLISERGNYNANETDINIANLSERGRAILSDAGEELIGHTFLIINDIVYIDKAHQADKISTLLKIGTMLALTTSNSNSSANNSALGIATGLKISSSLADMVAGFKVSVTSYLYQLVWNDNIANYFYKNFYFNKNNIDINKKREYEDEHNLFKLKLLGTYTSSSSKTVIRGLHSNDDVIRKVCARALDENYVSLSHKYDIFKIESPILTINKNELTSYIGMKEGVEINSKFEVLEIIKDELGRTKYKRVGIVKAEKDKIWDNRYMANEEEAIGANLGYTTFKILSGSNFYPGMLLREIQ